MKVQLRDEMFLSESKENGSYILKGVDGGRGIRMRLLAMGLFPGVKITIIKNDLSGPIILAVKRGRITVGRSLAKRVEIEEI